MAKVTEFTHGDFREEREGGFVYNLNRNLLLTPAEVVLENNRISAVLIHPIELSNQTFRHTIYFHNLYTALSL